MANPLINRSTDIEDVSFFPDADSPKLFYYGISATWEEITITKIGEKYEVIHGEIDFAPDPELLQRAKTQLGADRLQPIPIDVIDSDLRLGFELGENHTNDSSIVNTLPFPRFLLRVVIDLNEANASEVSSRIRENWGNYEGLLVGNTKAIVTGALLEMSFECSHPYLGIFDEITDSSTSLRQPRQMLEGAINAAFESKFDRWVSTDPSGSTNRLVITSFLTEFFFEAYSVEKEPIVRFDDGRVLNGFVLREPNEVSSDFLVSERKTIPTSTEMSAFGTRE